MKRLSLTALLCAAMLLMCACASSAQSAPSPTPTGAKLQGSADVHWPKDKLDATDGGVPTFSVYVVDAEKLENVDVETYVAGVLAGEMKNDWPLEALKAQAILARTFVLKFLDEKQSKYDGADISTDIEEAQAYDASSVNERITRAVAETKGIVLSAGGELPYAWFHAHSGGMTELAKPGLGWNKDEPTYTQAVKSNEPNTAADPDDAQALQDAATWEASFTPAEFAAAAKKQGATVDVTNGASLTIEKRGESGRAVTIAVNGAPLSATDLRIALGSTKMRSTLLTSLRVENGQVIMAGKGYGHGVGMSQWGAYGMATEGKTAEEIIGTYFQGVELAQLW